MPSTIALITALLLVAGSAAACERPMAETLSADDGATVRPAGRSIVQPARAGRALCAMDLVTAPADGHVVVRMRSGGNVHLPAGAILQLHGEAPDTGFLPALLRIASWRPRGAPRRRAATGRFTTAAVESMVPQMGPTVLTRSAGSLDLP